MSSETAAEFLDRYWEELNWDPDDTDMDRLFTLARRGAAMQEKPCHLCGAVQHWMPLPPPPSGEPRDE